ncbi:hypothetical protein H5410_060546 [Solanum commersonii]|uniref:Uncharacterized protein n=1 Tax=Solanum commersonii TaxID=4109 RepID=A0A9J5W6C3_SOLCO|nr:hypothetical protein H5410_060546 [Solanum commersonii]
MAEKATIIKDLVNERLSFRYIYLRHILHVRDCSVCRWLWRVGPLKGGVWWKVLRNRRVNMWKKRWNSCVCSMLGKWCVQGDGQIVPRASEILHEWDNIITIDIENGTEREIPEYQVWLRGDHNSISPEGKQGFEDVGTTIWIRHSRLGTKIATREMWAQMENIMQYLNNAGAWPSNVGASSLLPPPA